MMARAAKFQFYCVKFSLTTCRLVPQLS